MGLRNKKYAYAHFRDIPREDVRGNARSIKKTTTSMIIISDALPRRTVERLQCGRSGISTLSLLTSFRASALLTKLVISINLSPGSCERMRTLKLFSWCAGVRLCMWPRILSSWRSILCPRESVDRKSARAHTHTHTYIQR